jgi:hypothetical protein
MQYAHAIRVQSRRSKENNRVPGEIMDRLKSDGFDVDRENTGNINTYLGIDLEPIDSNTLKTSQSRLIFSPSTVVMRAKNRHLPHTFSENTETNCFSIAWHSTIAQFST